MVSLIIKSLIAVITFLLFFPAHGQEGISDLSNFTIAPSVFYYTGLRSRTSEDEKGYLVYDLKAAYQVYPNIFLGPAYQIEDEETKELAHSPSDLWARILPKANG